MAVRSALTAMSTQIKFQARSDTSGLACRAIGSCRRLIRVQAFTVTATTTVNLPAEWWP